MAEKEKFYITTPIYYVNSKPHIGHAYTTVMADVLARANRLRGREVFFLTGTDEHGDKVAKKAEEAGQTPKEFVDEIATLFKRVWKDLDISFDRFIRTTDEDHERGVAKIIEELHNQGDVYAKDYEGLYCVGCEKFLTEKDLVDGKCPDHGKEPEKVKEKNYFLRVSRYADEIRAKIEKDEILIRPETRKNEVLGMLKQGIEDFSISRESVKWGINVPFDKKQKIYVWADALLNYITALDYGEKGAKAKMLKRFWPADVQLVGKEILKFHAIYWPAILMALKLPLPKQIFVHGFFMVGGQKMSKTLGNVIAPEDIVERFSNDAARYLLISQFPTGEDGSTTFEQMEEQYVADLANDLGNLLQRTLVMMNKYGVPPVECEGNPFRKEVHKSFTARCPNAYRFDNEEFLKSLDEVRLYDALQIIKEIVSGGNKYIEKEKPWELAKENQEQCEYVLQGLYNRLMLVAHLIEPFMPGTAKEMRRQLEEMDPVPIFKK